MTSGARQLEFDRLMRQWWWFHPQYQADWKNPSAWASELLRRGETYRRFHERACSIPLPQNFIASLIYRERVRALVGTMLPLGRLDPARHWPELFLSDDRCAPALPWVELSDSTRRLIASRNAILPRQTRPADQFSIVVCRVLLKRDPDRQEIAYALEGHEQGGPLELARAGSTLNPAIMGKHPDYSVLPPELDWLPYAVILFDTRAGKAAAEQLSDWKANNFPQNHPPTSDEWLQQFARDATAIESERNLSRVRMQYRKVVPSKDQYQAQAWIPMHCLSKFNKIEAAFSTLLTSRERKEWRPRCLEAWDLPEEITLFGQPRTVRYEPYADAPGALKTKSGQLKFDTLKVGLAALDCRAIEPSFTQAGLLIPYLRANNAEDGPDLIHNAMKQVRGRIAAIDEIYAAL